MGEKFGKGIGGHHRPYRGFTNEWETPPEITQMFGPFDDDPCTPQEFNGLWRPWHGFVFINPPYGPDVGKWLEKLCDHGNGIALTFARTETRWFKEQVWARANGILFLYGRLHFYRNGQRADSNSGAPSVLIAYGSKALEQLQASKLPGALVTGWFP